MKKVTVIIFFIVVAVVFALIFTLYEYKEVPDVKWRQTYLPTEKEPYGTWMFRNLLNERYGSENVLDRYKDINLEEIDSSEKALLIIIGDRIDLDFAETDALANFSNTGHDIFISGTVIDFDYNWGLNNWEVGYKADSVLQVSYPSLSDNIFNFKFRTESLEDASEVYYRYFASGDLKINNLSNDSTSYRSIHSGSLDWENEIFSENGLDDLLQEDNLDDYIDEEEDEDAGYALGINQDSASIYKEWNFDGEFVGLHLLPQMFINEAAHQPFFLEHFNLLIGQYNYDKIIFEHPSFNRSKKADSESPIQFILDNRSLKWSYFTMLLGALLYVIFRGKRKQRIVPTLAPNNNTSLEYVQTLGSLYEHQNKPRKLVKHMQDVFYHNIKARYFLDQHDQQFIYKLSKKSNLAITEIETIVKTFSTIKDRFEFTDSDLSLLYRRLDAFYKNCK